MHTPSPAASIMVVDDTPANLKLLDELLRRRGYRVLLFTSGTLALRAAEANPPDLILLDVLMPQLDGFEVCRRLKLLPALQAVPVIFISALTEPEQKVHAFGVGAVDYVSKPFQEEEVMARVQTHLALYQLQRWMQEQQTRMTALVAERTQDLLRAQSVAHIGSWKLDLTSQALEWSAETYRLFGVPLNTPLTLASFLATVHDDDSARVAAAWQRALQGQPYDIEHRIAGTEPELWVRERAEFEFDAQGQAVRALGTVQDVTDRKHAELTLQAERLRLETAINAAQAGTWEWDVLRGTQQVNARMAAMVGYSPSEAAHLSCEQLRQWIHPDDQPLEARVMAQHLAGATALYELEMRLRHRQGHVIWVRSTGQVMRRSPCGEPLLVAGISVDITEQKTHHEQLDYVTHHDALTGLPNRSRFVSQLAQVMQAHPNRPLGVAYLDLDNFATINTAHGLDLGSALILEISRRLQGALADGQYLARIGGDEFAALLPLNDQTQTPDLQRMLDAVQRPLHLRGLDLQLSASIGLTTWPQPEPVDAEQLLRQADQAMYLAKLAGKGRLHLFDAVHDVRARERFSRIDEIRAGLLLGEFVLYYQPKLHLNTGTVIGFEALIRWQHPTQGLLAPGLFIPALEGDPAAIQLGDWVIETALAQLAAWLAQGLRTTVSVNIDRLQLQDPGFVPRLRSQLAAQPTVQPQQLELEILETGALENMARVSALISQVQALGIECALDDFGTGFSSLTFLKQLGAHTIKIDQSFVRGLLDDSENAAIVNSVVNLAHNFERRPLAEGIETVAHGEALIEFGCAYGQGYAIARPMPATAVIDWLTTWQVPESWTESSPVSPQDLPALLAETEHRGWLKRLRAWLLEPGVNSTAFDNQHCRFALWLEKPATLRRYRHQPNFVWLQGFHRDLHTQASALLALKAANPGADLQPHLSALDALSQQLQTELRRLLASESDSQWLTSSFSHL